MSGKGRAPDVVLCRGCCCGTDDKHPDVDHAAQRTALEQAARRTGARLVVADCLDACDRSNVVPQSAGAGRGGSRRGLVRQP